MMTMIEAKKIATVMGLTQKVHTLSELTKEVQHGLQRKTLVYTVQQVTRDRRVEKRIINQIIPRSSHIIRKKLLSPAESERVERVARVYAMAVEVWGDDEAARTFLSKPHPMLNNQSPLETSINEPGASQVEQLLEKLRYGLPA